MSKKISMSICTYQNGDFEIMFEKDGKEIVFEGNQKLSEEEFEIADSIAPACVWTQYKRVIIKHV